MQRDRSENFQVKEVTFQESVDIADEDYGDALGSLDLGESAPKAATATPASTKRLAEVLAAPQPTTARTTPRGQPVVVTPPETTAGEAAPKAAPRRGLFARLFGWLFR